MNFNHIVDRIAVLSSAIHEKASHATHDKSHYVDAMLHRPLAAYVREAEVVESRMFVVPQPGPGEIPSAVDLARKETASATPLKKARDTPLALLEPEEYIRSVLRLGEKYNVMPRAQSYARELLQRTEELQKKIPELEREYKESMSKVGRGTPGSTRKKTRTLKEEERLTREAEARAATLREQRDILLKRLSANASAAESVSTSDASMFTSPSTIKGGSHIATMNLPEGCDSSASVSNPVQPAPKRTTVQELQARRQARQAARQAQRNQFSNAPLPTTVTEEEKAFWGGGSTPSPSTLFAGAPHPQGPSVADTSTNQPETETENEEGTPVSRSREASDIEGETGDEEGEGDVTIVLEPKQQTQPRRTFSLLRQSITITTATPGELAPDSLQTEVSSAPSFPRQQPPKPDPTIRLPEPLPISTSDMVSDSTAKDEGGAQIQNPSKPTSPYAFNASTPEVALQMTRVWKTVGEILIPDNSYAKSSNGPGTEITLDILSAIASLPTRSEDPSGERTGAVMLLLDSHRVPAASALPIIPSAIQVITAALILTLLEYVVATGSDAVPADNGYIWMPQSSLKATLKNNPWAIEALTNGGVDWVMKTMLKVVPTKLIVLDRKGGIVRFGKE